MIDKGGSSGGGGGGGSSGGGRLPPGAAPMGGMGFAAQAAMGRGGLKRTGIDRK